MMSSPEDGWVQLREGCVFADKLWPDLFQIARPSTGAVSWTGAGGVPLPHLYVSEKDGMSAEFAASVEWNRMLSPLV